MSLVGSKHGAVVSKRVAMVSKHGTIKKPNPRLKWLIPAFENLDQVIVKFIDSEEEPPFWYNETARVSLLVAAAARSSYVALADYRSPKRKSGKKSKGRCDLYLAKESWLKVEAKLQWVYAATKPESVTKALERARDDAKKLLTANVKRSPEKEHRRHCAGLLFAVMSLKEDQAENFNPKTFKLFERKFCEVESDFSWLWYDSKFPSYCWEDKKHCSR
jgi:hypothetical protein